MCSLQWDDVSTVTNSEATTALETLRRIKCGPRGKQVMLSLGSAAFQVQRCIGQGAFASVYEVCMLRYDVRMLPSFAIFTHCLVRSRAECHHALPELSSHRSTCVQRQSLQSLAGTSGGGRTLIQC